MGVELDYEVCAMEEEEDIDSFDEKVYVEY